MSTSLIEPFEGPVTVVNGVLKSEVDEFDGLEAWPELQEGSSYYIHAEYGPDNEVLVRHSSELSPE